MTSVRRSRFKPLAEITTAGRVFLISLPRVGSNSTHQISPRLTAIGITGGFTFCVRLWHVLKPVANGHIPLCHLGCELFVPFHVHGGQIKWIVVAILRRQGLFEQLLNESTSPACCNMPFETLNQFVGQANQELLRRHRG